MNRRRQREAESLELRQAEGGFQVAANRELLQSFREFIEMNHPDLIFPDALNNDLGHLGFLIFDPVLAREKIEAAIADWRSWYASEARQLLSRFEQMMADYRENYPDLEPALCIDESTFRDFQETELSDNEIREFGISQTDEADLSVDDQYCRQALKNIFIPKGVSDVVRSETTELQPSSPEP